MTTQRTRRDQALWQKLVDQQLDSGLNAAAFCRKAEINYPSFMNWRKRLRPFVSEAEQPVRLASNRFIELTPTYHANENDRMHPSETSTRSSSSFCVELSLGDGIELRISRGC
jgi:hypothetical protein